MADRGSRFLSSTLAVCAAATCLFFPAPACPEAHGRAASAAERPALAEITFSGYQALPGGRGILFVELTDPVAVEESRAGNVIEYRLVGTTVPLKNNKNPLLLRDFDSSALTARLVPERPERGKRKRPSVRLVITLRANVTPTHRMVARGKGAALEVELPAPPTTKRN